MTHIRPADAKDAEKIVAILNPIIRDTTISFTTVEKSADDIAASILDHETSGHGFLVADDGAIQGVASYAPFRGSPGYDQTMELTIYLAGDARGKGLAAKLLAALEDHARAQGIHVMIAAVSTENEPGLRFHAKAGFKTVGTLAQVGRKFDRWLDMTLMQKIL